MVGGFCEVKMESSAGEGVSMGKGVWALFLEKQDKMEGILVDLSFRLVSNLTKPDKFVNRFLRIRGFQGL